MARFEQKTLEQSKK